MNKKIKCPNKTIPYTIEKGDTLYLVAKTFGVSLDSIMATNPEINPDKLYPGQIICVPASCSYGTLAYIIKKGDTLYSISRKYNSNIDKIIATNPGINPDNLMIGDIICIPI